ncbi:MULTISPECIES: DUF1365 domain-containing protein [Legionella]|uniref:Chromosome partitioning protein ParA n=1 Tax=Legionella drozanskii LLAP-1 TaxID=1212489 RepID=A0A0W0SVS0_9GAMM|nr:MULTISPECIES: DUF1365 domain-containing protein [Legionella]KTC87470.1 hypothetical protein Ldro_1089 [Legionella drozanskii LLAP-1]PJE08214.1 MAG: DUF1365 domain-containing protein [Legionella sp.]
MFENLIFTGEVRHRRFTPKTHQFSYKLFMFCFDIGDLPNSFKDIKQVSIEKFNWFSFRRINYLSHPEIPLDEYARQLVVAKFHTYPKGKIYLLTHLTCLGYCFNPISLYFIFDETNQQLDYLIIEVTNTPWGEKHNYVLESSGKPKNDLYHYQFQKELHVSPFMAMNYEYQFNLKLNKREIIVHMENHIDGKKDFDATLRLKASAQKAPLFTKVFKRYPWITYKLAVAIYWQALKLWLKGVPFHFHPKRDKRT